MNPSKRIIREFNKFTIYSKEISYNFANFLGLNSNECTYNAVKYDLELINNEIYYYIKFYYKTNINKYKII